MYEKIGTGEMINGQITVRRKHTMTVIGEDGYTHLCKLVGKPDEIVAFHDWNTTKANEKNRVACRAIFKNGDTQDFQSIQAAAHHFMVSTSTVSRQTRTNKAVTKGRLKGVRFEKVILAD